MLKLNRLTPLTVNSLNLDGVYADGAGLYLRVRGGAKHWLFIFRQDGKRREMGLGPFPRVKLAKAREKAQAAREMLEEGLDPRTKPTTPARPPTFGELADAFIADRQSGLRNDKSLVRWRRALADGGYAQTMRDIRIDEVDTEAVLAVLKPIWTVKSETAKNVRGYVERVLDAARARGLRHGDNPARWRGHLDHLLAAPPRLARGHLGPEYKSAKAQPRLSTSC
jgi:hypothetical protein